MKNLATILSVFSIVVLITACEKSPEVPEVEFNLPLIPGQYKGDTEVMGTQFNFIRRIPESFHKDNKGYITEINNCTLTADKGYLFKPYQMDLFHSRQINLKTPMRFNQHVKESFPIIFKRARKGIAILFSQMYDQHMRKRNYAKTRAGLAIRLLCEISAVTILQHINFLNNKPLNHLKYALAV